MRSARRLAIRWLVLGGGLGASLVACFDLFHSTADVLTACEIDASTFGCSADATPPPPPPRDAAREADVQKPTDFCAWDAGEALMHARHACAWLGACETPMGGNAFGPCMFQALQAYDCQANPYHRVQGDTFTLWDCLWKVHPPDAGAGEDACGEVDTCVYRGPRPNCMSQGGAFTNCSQDDGRLRVECPDVEDGEVPARGGENCALAGLTCMPSGGPTAECTGTGGLACEGIACSADGTHLRWCVDGGDQGIDCSSASGSTCGMFPADAMPDAQWAACRPVADGGACTPEPSASCDGGVATECLAGSFERINCGALLQNDAACQGGPLDLQFDWREPCRLEPAACDADTCDAGVVACARGAQIVLPSCAAEGLGACEIVPTDLGTEQHARCAPP